MEGVSASVYRGLRGYLRRRGYRKLSGNGKRRRPKIKIKIKLKLKFKLRRIPSPNKLLLWLRDAYVNLMMRFANSRMFAASYGGASVTAAGSSFGARPLKEYDDKMIIDIYRTLMLSSQPQRPT